MSWVHNCSIDIVSNWKDSARECKSIIQVKVNLRVALFWFEVWYLSFALTKILLIGVIRTLISHLPVHLNRKYYNKLGITKVHFVEIRLDDLHVPRVTDEKRWLSSGKWLHVALRASYRGASDGLSVPHECWSWRVYGISWNNSLSGLPRSLHRLDRNNVRGCHRQRSPTYHQAAWCMIPPSRGRQTSREPI
jgi:hypothetical protein